MEINIQKIFLDGRSQYIKLNAPKSTKVNEYLKKKILTVSVHKATSPPVIRFLSAVVPPLLSRISYKSLS